MNDPVVLHKTAERFGLEVGGRSVVDLPVPRLGRVRAYVLPGYEEKDDGYLLHLGLTAHLRALLGVPPERWRYPSGVGETLPDAEALLDEGVYAVEVDLTYPPEKLERKVQAYKERYAGQVWGVSGAGRARRVMALAWPKPVKVIPFILREVLG